MTVAGLDDVCDCGHTYGQHGHQSPHRCYFTRSDESICECRYFAALLIYINDDEIAEAWHAIPKWFA